MAPTLLDLAGLPIPNDKDGRSLVPILRHPDTQGCSAFLMKFWRYFPENTPNYEGVRTQRYTYVEFERGRSPWLFDLWNDPDELVNLYNLQALRETLRKMWPLLEDYKAR